MSLALGIINVRERTIILRHIYATKFRTDRLGQTVEKIWPFQLIARRAIPLR